MTPERAEAIRTLYLQMRNSAWSAMVVSVYMIGTAAPYTLAGDRRLGGGAACHPARARRSDPRLAPARARRRRNSPPGRTFTRGYMVVTGALWGSTIYLFAHPAEPITVALTMCCLYSVARRQRAGQCL